MVIPQDTKFAANIKKNILPAIKMPPGFKIELFALAPDARHMAVSRNKGTVWIGTRKTKVWQVTGAGNSVIIPNITAQQKDYLVARLKSYKSGKIEHPQMTVVSSNLKIFIDQLRKSIISSSDGLMFFILASVPEAPSGFNAT